MSSAVYSLLAPVGPDENAVPRLTRPPPVNFRDKSDRFRLHRREYACQYARVYFSRLQALRAFCLRAAEQHFPGVEVLAGLKDAQPDKPSVIIGTIYKEMKLKPDALREYLHSLDLEEQVKSYLDDSDRLLIEDESGRFSLNGPTECLPVHQYVTGLILAIRGVLNSRGHFDVEQVIFPALPIMPQVPTIEATTLAFVSGLQFANPKCNHARLLRLRDFLTTAKEGQNIARVIIVGNTVDNVDKSLNLSMIEAADTYLAGLASSVCVDLMPGELDPTNLSMPQQAMSGALFRESRMFASFRCVPNPYAFELSGIKFLGSSGQPVCDLTMYSEMREPMDALEMCVKARCIAPTAPDTLACFPFGTGDPFSMESDADFPHVVFSGGHEKCSWRRLDNGTVAVIVPSFLTQPVVVLVELPSLTIKEVSL